MKAYTLVPGSIAAMLHVRDGDRTIDCIYMDARKIEAYGLDGISRGDCFASLPVYVAAAVAGHFKIVFSLPVEQRGAYLKGRGPWLVGEGEAPNAPLQ